MLDRPAAQEDRAPWRNRILSALPEAERQRLSGAMREEDLPHHTYLYRTGEPVQRIYFLEAGMISLVQPMRDGRMVEVGTVGIDSAAGSPSLFTTTRSALDTMVQVPGRGYSIGLDELLEECRRNALLLRLLQGTFQMLLAQIAQTAACNRLHSLDQRLRRWLLTAHDNAEGARFKLTHDFLAMMLGVQRPGVSIAAAALQEAGVIGYTRGVVWVLDRGRLETGACECYATLKTLSAAVLSEAEKAAPSSFA